MKLPKRIDEILARKEDFLLRREAHLNTAIQKMQLLLVNKVTEEIIPQLDVSAGRIKNTLKNYRLLRSLDKLYNDFEGVQRLAFVSEIGDTVKGIQKFNVNFFTISLGAELPAIFESVVAQASKKIGMRLGLADGDIIAGGFLETLIKNEGLLLELKQFMAQSVTAQARTKDFITGANELITGGAEGVGGIDKQFKRYAHDIYMQYDSAYSNSLAEKTGLKYFMYLGGKIKDSRDFCMAHDAKVWSRDEAEKWPEWTPSLGVYPEGYKIKQKATNEVPSYLSYPGYSPLIDRGGYNCRHHLGWISTDLAKKWRPEIEE